MEQSYRPIPYVEYIRFLRKMAVLLTDEVKLKNNILGKVSGNV